MEAGINVTLVKSSESLLNIFDGKARKPGQPNTYKEGWNRD